VTEVTRLLKQWRDGDPDALDELTPLVYAELRKLADSQMRRERSGHTLQPTALVHEAYLRLLGHRAGFANRLHFYGAAAHAMRRVLVDYARSRGARKRGVADVVVDLDTIAGAAVNLQDDLVALDQALDRLADIAPRAAKVLELRYFGGLSVEETATFLDVAPATVKRHWSFARAWLYRRLSPT
jgi:RNA polymerase sigma factor (TIGR02999 family)